MPPDPNLERRWLADTAQGDRAAFECLYRAYHQRVFGYLVRMVGSAENAEELATDVMLEVWKAARTFKGESKVSTWILGIARFKGLTLLRRLRPDAVDIEEAGPIASTDDRPDETLDKDTTRARIAAALARLSPDHREVMELTFFQGCSYPEIATVVGCPVNTVKTRMFHARKQLRELLAEEDS